MYTSSPYLFAFLDLDWMFWWNVLLCLIVLGLIIFVHELGHFLVAKWCGVRCDKFYLGFDFFGLKLCRFTWGETEYGIGVFPLGGYVKMLGQEDNPAELKRQLEEAEQMRSSGQENVNIPSEEAIREALTDPRSYQAKSVPQRMAIIVAGVTMNAIFALVCAILAYSLGVSKSPAVVSDVLSGLSGWQGGLQADDTITSINNIPVTYFEEIPKHIALGDNLEQGVPLVFTREGLNTALGTKVYPKKYTLAPMLGATSGVEMYLDANVPVTPYSAAAQAYPQLKGRDEITMVNGRNVNSYLDFQKAVYAETGKTLKLSVKRKSLDGTNSEENITTEITPRKFRHFGIIFKMGPVQGTRMELSGISPAHSANIQPGDQITGILMNGKVEPISDPVLFPEIVRKMAAAEKEPGAEKTGITLEIQPAPQETQTSSSPKQDEAQDPVSTEKKLVHLPFLNDPAIFQSYELGSGISISEIGLAYMVENTVLAVIPGSAAEKEGILPGDKITSVEYVRAEPRSWGEFFASFKKKDTPEDLNSVKTDKKPSATDLDSVLPRSFTLLLRDGVCSVPVMLEQLQFFPDNTHVNVHVVRENAADATLKNRKLKLDLMEYPDLYVSKFGLNFAQRRIMMKSSPLDAVIQGSQETWHSLTLVFRSIKKFSSGQVSTRGMGGPVLIAQMAYRSAQAGLATLLIFTCLISANLAVMNLLPIPILDGGHVMFLLYEWVVGRPPNEKIMVILTFGGLFLFLALTVYVFGLDLGFIPRY